MADSPFAIDSLNNMDVLYILAAAVQAPGVEGDVLGLPVLLWGAPGVGKTSQVNKMAKALGFAYLKDGEVKEGAITVLASVREPSGFLGLPVPGQYMTPTGIIVQSSIAAEMIKRGEKVMAVLTYAPPDWAVRAGLYAGDDIGNVDAPRSLIFFDEIATAGAQVQAALLRVIHERVTGDYPLPPNVAVVAAANPPSMSPGGVNLSPPAANRFIHMFWAPPTPAQWADWLVGSSATTKAKTAQGGWPRLNMAAFYNYFQQFKVAAASWVRTQAGGQYLFKMPNEEWLESVSEWFRQNPGEYRGMVSELNETLLFTDQYAWPSPRSLEIAVRARAAVMALEAPQGESPGEWAIRRAKMADAVVCGTIGTHACELMNAYVQNVDIVAVGPDELLKSAAARTAFFNRSPSDEILRVELERFVFYFAELPVDQQFAAFADFQSVLGAFVASTISAGSVKAAYDAFRVWKDSPEGGVRKIAAAQGAQAQQNIVKMISGTLRMLEGALQKKVAALRAG